MGWPWKKARTYERSDASICREYGHQYGSSGRCVCGAAEPRDGSRLTTKSTGSTTWCDDCGHLMRSGICVSARCRSGGA